MQVDEEYHEHVEHVLSAAAARVESLEQDLEYATPPRYTSGDIFKRTRVRLAESLATFEQHDLVQSEMRQQMSPPSSSRRLKADVGRWRYDSSLGRAVRYGTAPIVDTGRRTMKPTSLCTGT